MTPERTIGAPSSKPGHISWSGFLEAIMKAISMRARILASAVAALLAMSAAVAHEGGIDARGVVKAVTAERLTIETAGGEKTFSLTPETSYARGSAPARREDLRTGERIVVHARERGDRLEAVEVRAGPSGGPAKAR